MGPDTSRRLHVATCQFPVSAGPAENGRWVMRQMHEAKLHGADVVHFCEGALSGFAPSDLANYNGYDWEVLEQTARKVFACAGELGLWLVLGSAHRLSGDHLPHNSLYIVNSEGELVDRYDKRFCETLYSPGDHPTVFEVGGIRCGALICWDFRFPELYRDYKRAGVELIFHSFHAAHVPPTTLAAARIEIGDNHMAYNRAPTIPGILMPASMTAAAGANHIWISAANSSAPYSCWGAFFVRADGITTGRLARNRPGVLISTVDTAENLYDSTARARDNALAGVLHSGELIHDPRSQARTSL